MPRPLALPVLALALVLLGVARAAETDAARPALPLMAVGVSSLGAVACDGFLYAYGGHTGKAHSYSTKTVSGAFARLNLARPDAWESLPAGPGLQGLNLAAHGGKVYRVGGMAPRNAPGEPADNRSTAEVAAYDPAAKGWARLPDLPEPRSSHDAVVVGDTLVVVGGWNLQGDAEPKWHASALALDLKAARPEWRTLAQPFQRRALTAAAVGTRLYVLGGLTPENGSGCSTDILDVATGAWSKGPAYPGGGMNGFSPAACELGGRLYLSAADGNVYRLSADGSAWETAGVLAHRRFVHRLVPAPGGRLVAVGGASKGGNVTAVEAVTPTK